MSPVSQMRKLRLAAAPFLPGLASFPSYRLWGESFLSLHTEKAWLSENLLETTSSFLEPTFCIHTEPRVAASTPGLGEGTAVGGGDVQPGRGGGPTLPFCSKMLTYCSCLQTLTPSLVGRNTQKSFFF